MTDESDQSPEQEDEILLDKLDSMLRRHRREYSSLIHAAEQAVSVEALASEVDTSQVDTEPPPDTGEIPVLNEKVTLSIDEWPAQTEISELLYFAFDAAVRETQISLTPAERLTLIQALAKRLPKNF